MKAENVECRGTFVYAERKNRVALLRSDCSAAGATAGVTVFFRASGYNCSAKTSAEAIRCCGSFARQEARISSSSLGIEEFTCEGGNGLDDST